MPEKILQEEKGIFDSREAEKEQEPIPEPVEEIQAPEEEAPSGHHDEETWSTRQSTMEERVIDHYVIETHPEEAPSQAPEESHHQQEVQEQEQPEVLVTGGGQGEEQEAEEDEAAVEREFTAALQEDRFSAELLSQSLREPEPSGELSIRRSFSNERNFFNQSDPSVGDAAKLRMSSSQTPPPSPFDATTPAIHPEEEDRSLGKSSSLFSLH